LYPVFSGTIVAHGGELTVSGWYAPPGGGVGRVADRALLHIAAEGTARWLLGALDDDAAQGGGLDLVGRHEVVLGDEGRRLRALLEVQLRQNAADVVLDRPVGQKDLAGEFAW
jgi:hypothetical protein